MAMSRKDYVAVASAFNDAGDVYRSDGAAGVLLMAAQGVADYCQSDNPRFNRARFIAACFAYQKG